jgi:CheY-like chemotaxis protein
MQTQSDNAWFARHLRTALNSLYDPSVLRNSPLGELLGAGQRGEVASTLRRTLIDAIESLRPNVDTPLASRTWRVYQILRRRYTEQLTQREVAADLGLSIRQLQREEKLAREVLADHLWNAHDLGARGRNLIPRSSEADDGASPMDAETPTRQQELEWLRDSVPVQMTEVGEAIREVLGTIDPLLKSSHVRAEYEVQGHPSCIPLQAPILRQALLNIVSTVSHYVPGGQVHIQARILPQQVRIHIQASSAGSNPDATSSRADSPEQRDLFESLEMAEQLIRLSQGSLEITSGEGEEPAPHVAGGEVITVKITFPFVAKTTVLVIDDNADALQLLQRYLSSSRYRFVGTTDPQEGLTLAEELMPQIIVLDVMMPEQDGWALLGQLREHPKTHDIPVVVYTILSQEELALTLGAAEFIRKPVNRATLLSTLDRQLDRQRRESG